MFDEVSRAAAATLREPTQAPEAGQAPEERQAEERQAEDTASFDNAPVADEHHRAGPTEQVPPVDRPAASDDHDREPPR